MAACRKDVPLRATTGVFQIGDGTMCRMPSPLPGPIRVEANRAGMGEGNAFGGDLIDRADGPSQLANTATAVARSQAVAVATANVA